MKGKINLSCLGYSQKHSYTQDLRLGYVLENM